MPVQRQRTKVSRRRPRSLNRPNQNPRQARPAARRHLQMHDSRSPFVAWALAHDCRLDFDFECLTAGVRAGRTEFCWELAAIPRKNRLNHTSKNRLEHRFQPRNGVLPNPATSRKMSVRRDFAIAERGNLGNDFLVGRANVRDGTRQAAKWLVLADQSKRVALFKKGRWSSGFRQ